VTIRLLAILIICGMLIPSQQLVLESQHGEMTPSQDDSGSPTAPRVYGVDHSREIYSAVTLDAYQGFVRNFSEIGERHILEAADAYVGNNKVAREYIVEQMTTLSQGRMKVEIVEKHLNVVGKLPGYLPGDNPGFAIVGHYDTWYTGMGANEGGAGIAAILSLIEPLSAYEWPLDIYFIATNGRYAQWGPFGSDEIALWFANQGIDLMMIYTMEALLVPDPEAPHDEQVHMVYLDAGTSNFHLGQYWAELAQAMSKNVGLNLVKAVPNHEFLYWGWRYLEATYFLERGYFQSTVAVESGFEIDEDLRTPRDEWTNTAYRYYLGQDITGAIGASIAFTMSRAYGEGVQYNCSFELERGTTRNYYIPISTATTIDVRGRWFGGTATFEIHDPSDAIIAYHAYNRTSAWNSTNVFSLPVTQKGLYRLRISNTGFNPVGHVLEYSYDSDIDGNSVPDSQEYWLDTALFHQDSDSDTISNAMEIIRGTDLDNPDSDADTMPDQYEIAQGFDPLNPDDALEDADGDSLTNAEEYSLGLDPFNVDSDGDSLPDNWELDYGLDPHNDDSHEDPDEDERSNLEEYLMGSNPLVAEVTMTIRPEWAILPSVIMVVSVSGFYVWRRRQEQRRIEESDYF
jgi:hypothetical protein